MTATTPIWTIWTIWSTASTIKSTTSPTRSPTASTAKPTTAESLNPNSRLGARDRVRDLPMSWSPTADRQLCVTSAREVDDLRHIAGADRPAFRHQFRHQFGDQVLENVRIGRPPSTSVHDDVPAVGRAFHLSAHHM